MSWPCDEWPCELRDARDAEREGGREVDRGGGITRPELGPERDSGVGSVDETGAAPAGTGSGGAKKPCAAAAPAPEMAGESAGGGV